MTNWIAFLRGINVGGKHIVPMKELAALLEREGCVDVATYIQSGNIVFRHTGNSAANLELLICEAVDQEFGFRPHVILMKEGKLRKIAAENPFPAAEAIPKSLHLCFLSERPRNADVLGINKLKSETEEYALSDEVFYLHAPDGIGRSKLAAKVEKLLGVPATARNWRTVSKVLALVHKLPA